MASPNPDQFASQARANQPYQQGSSAPQRSGISQTYNISHSHPAQYGQQPAPYVQPHYYNNAPVPTIAELPAPPPPAPPTTTPNQQLKEDELLAHKLQQIEVTEIRRRSASFVNQQQQPINYASRNLYEFPPLTQQQSTSSLRPHSTSLPSDGAPWSPGSFGAPSTSSLAPVNSQDSSFLPEGVTRQRPLSYSAANDYPIPVTVGQQSSKTLPGSSDSAALSTYLEEYRQPPYPPQWKPLPVLATFYAYNGDKSVSGSDWLSQQDTVTWRTIRPTEHAYNPAAPSYTFNFATKGGSYRDSKFTWSMTPPEETHDPKKKPIKSSKLAWTYELRLDRSSGMRKAEVLGHGKQKTVLTTYVHARNYDSLRFIGPDGRAYMWVSSGNVSSINGSRLDTNRHALFASVGRIQDPLYGEIVADHTFWDGYVDESEVHTNSKCDGCQANPINGKMWKCKTCHQHDVCEACRRKILSGGFGKSMQQACNFSLICLPDEALYIRSPKVDPALIVATLQVLKDWELHTIRQERKKNPMGFISSEQAARRYDLGVMSHWKASDWDKKHTVNEKRGTMIKAARIASIPQAKDDSASALSNLVGAGFALGGPGYGTSGASKGDTKGSNEHQSSVGGSVELGGKEVK